MASAELRPHFVKCRELGKKSWVFLSSKGTSRLRVHAIRFASAERAQALIGDNAADNPEWEFKITPVEA